jgi:hypothetical protein
MRDRILSKTQDAAVGYIWDPIENSRWHLLRGLPALQYMGISDFTYPTSWCQFNRGKRYTESDYEYHVVSGIPDVPDPAPDFGAITNRYYETETPYTIKYLIDRYTTVDALLLVLTDDKRLTPQGGRRPLYQEPFVEAVGSYESIYQTFEEAYSEAGWDLPLTDTKNLFIQDNAILYEYVTDEAVSTTTELFTVLPEAPFLPLYDVFTELFGREDEPGASPLGSEDEIVELARWLRRRVEWTRETAQEVARELNQAVIDDGSVFDPAAARRSPTVRDARVKAKDIDMDASAIDQRYADWLTRYDL